jgi:hypothetical protein
MFCVQRTFTVICKANEHQLSFTEVTVEQYIRIGQEEWIVSFLMEYTQLMTWSRFSMQKGSGFVAEWLQYINIIYYTLLLHFTIHHKKIHLDVFWMWFPLLDLESFKQIHSPVPWPGQPRFLWESIFHFT